MNVPLCFTIQYTFQNFSIYSHRRNVKYTFEKPKLKFCVTERKVQHKCHGGGCYLRRFYALPKGQTGKGEQILPLRWRELVSPEKNNRIS
jgi:hypothetical protein